MARQKGDSSSNHNEAARLYIEEGLSVGEIAEKLKVSVQTVYKYKADDAANKSDWDRQRKVWAMSPSEISNLYAFSLRRLLVEIDSDPRQLLNPAVSDAVTKSIKNLQRINPRHQYLGVIIDLIKATDQYLGEVDSKLQESMRKHWDPIKNRLVEALGKESIF
ncbi:MAG TPA: DUF1804 family protein [Rectinemataceae bacterium]|nr:DUF1804 family protein [Rectinemataceae bacterium]